MSWPVVALSTVCEIDMGSAPKGISYVELDQGVPLIAGAGDYGDKFPAPKKATSVPTKLCKKGDIILCVRATIGDLNWADKEYCLGRGVAGLRVHSKKLDSMYLWYFVTSYEDELYRNSTGSTFPQINRAVIESIQIPLPPLETQKQIAAILEKADQLRKDCKQMEQELHNLAQSVFIDMFGDPVTNPKGWGQTTLGDEAKLLAGFAFKSKDYSKNPQHTKLCRGINISPGSLNWHSAEYWDYKNEECFKKYELSEGDVVIAMDRPWISGGFKIAKVTQDDLPSLLLQRVMRVRGDTAEETCFYYYVLRQPAFLLHTYMTETTIPHISPKDIFSYSIPKPSKARLTDFYNAVKNIENNYNNLEAMSLEAKDNFNSLMQRAFKGELNLKEVA